MVFCPDFVVLSGVWEYRIYTLRSDLPSSGVELI